jgi:hypothetical protein
MFASFFLSSSSFNVAFLGIASSTACSRVPGPHVEGLSQTPQYSEVYRHASICSTANGLSPLKTLFADSFLTTISLAWWQNHHCLKRAIASCCEEVGPGTDGCLMSHKNSIVAADCKGELLPRLKNAARAGMSATFLECLPCVGRSSWLVIIQTIVE